MLQYIRTILAKGPLFTSIMVVGGNTQVSVKVQILEVDEIGMVCRTKGMLGGYGEIMLRPWASIAWVDIPPSNS
jgi:hypothetical protein